MILPCICKHDYQDSLYGHGNRVMNPDKEAQQYICTVCGTKRSKGNAAPEKKKEKTKK